MVLREVKILLLGFVLHTFTDKLAPGSTWCNLWLQVNVVILSLAEHLNLEKINSKYNYKCAFKYKYKYTSQLEIPVAEANLSLGCVGTGEAKTARENLHNMSWTK